MEIPQNHARLETLSNGLTLILESNRLHPVVSVQIWLETGSVHEGTWLGAGLSHLLEHMVFKGAALGDGASLAAMVQQAGGHWNAYTSFDRTVYHIDGPAKSALRFIEILSSMVFHPTLPLADFEREKDVIRREIDMGLDDPGRVLSQLFFSAIFRSDARRHPVIGHRQQFDRLSHEDLLTYHRSRYTPGRAIVVVSGDVDEYEVMQQIVRLLGDLPMGDLVEPPVPTEMMSMGASLKQQEFAVSTVRTMLGWKTPSMRDKDFAVYSVAAAVLGRGQSSLLYRELRENQELAIEIGAWAWCLGWGDGLLAISAEAEPERVEALCREVEMLLQRAQQLDLNWHLQRVKRQLMVTQLRSLTTASGRANDLASNWHLARDLNFTRHYVTAIQRVTEQQVKQVFSELVAERAIRVDLRPQQGGSSALLMKETGKKALDNVLEWQLENGLRVVFLHDPHVPLCSMTLQLHGGVLSDDLETAGVCELMASALVLGSQQRSIEAMAARLDEMGAHLSATSGKQSVSVNASCLSDDCMEVLQLMAEVVIEPLWDEDALRRELASMKAAVTESMEDPFEVANLRLMSALFSQHGYALPVGGTLESLAQVTSEHVKRRHRDLFQAANAVLVVVGSIDAVALRQHIYRSFAPMPAGGAWLLPSSQQVVGEAIELSMEKHQAIATVAYAGLSYQDSRRFALMLLMEYVSDMAGPLFVRIREELGLAYQVGAYSFYGHDAGAVVFYLSTAPEQLQQANDELARVISAIAASGIPEANFEQVRATVLSAKLLDQQSPAVLARSIASSVLRGDPWNTFQLDRHRIEQVTAAEVQELAGSLLANSAFTSVRVVGNKITA